MFLAPTEAVLPSLTTALALQLINCTAISNISAAVLGAASLQELAVIQELAVSKGRNPGLKMTYCSMRNLQTFVCNSRDINRILIRQLFGAG